jgi:hypothetical protein
MSWSYRVIRHEDDGGISYAIHECHYDKKGDTIPTSWTIEPAGVLAETRTGLFWVTAVMTEAIGQPVLEARDGKLREVEPKKALSDDLKAVLEMGKLIGTGDYDPESHADA